MSLTFNANDGTIWPLDGSAGVLTVDEDEGIFTIPTDLVVDQRVNADGAVLLNSRRSPRRVVLSFFLAVDEDPPAGALLQLWASFFRSLASGGELVYDGVNGQRTLRDIMLEGPDRSMTGRDIGFHSEDTYQVSLVALDPWWYGAQATSAITIGAPTAWNAAIPWNSAIPWDGGAATAITVTGDVPAFPLWTLKGAITTLSVGVVDAAWTWTTTLATGAYGTVDHRPGTRSPRLGSELNGVEESAFGLWYLLDQLSTLDWGLEPGITSLIVGATGTDGTTSLSMTYEPRFLTP